MHIFKSFQKEKGKKEANENRKGERKEDILPDGIDSLTLNMIDDLEHRIRKKKDEGINELGKIQLQKHENTLTALYVVLQKVIIQSTAQHYGIGEKDNKSTISSKIEFVKWSMLLYIQNKA